MWIHSTRQLAAVLIAIFTIFWTAPHEVSSIRRYKPLKTKFQKVRHAAGKYKYKEEVIKKVEHDHPCKLTQTSVKVNERSLSFWIIKYCYHVLLVLRLINISY